MTDETIRALIREKLAALAHEQWSGWMRYLFSRCETGPTGALVMPPEWENRWRRQVETPYADLSEAEKDSDRGEADRVLAVLTGASPLSELVTCSLRSPDDVAHLRRLDCQHEAPHLIAACGAFRAPGVRPGASRQELFPHEDEQKSVRTLRWLAQVIGSGRFREVQTIEGNDSFVDPLEPAAKRRIANVLHDAANRSASPRSAEETRQKKDHEDQSL